jgi:hypothetical protein
MDIFHDVIKSFSAQEIVRFFQSVNANEYGVGGGF